jgi:hypothetical protein
MNKKYIVRLTPEEREGLEKTVKKGKGAASRIKHANILLKADADGPAWCDERIADAFSVHPLTVRNVRERTVLEGLDAALNPKRRATPPTAPILDGAGEARVIALACSTPPEGRTRWTLHLLADKIVELKIADAISHETVRKTLKKTR